MMDGPITSLLIGVVVFSMTAMAFVGMFVDVNTSGNYALASPMNNMTAFSKTVTSVNSTLSQIQTEFATDKPSSVWQNPLLAPYVAARLLFGTVGMVSGLVQDVATLGETSTGSAFIPTWFTAGLITIVGIIVVLGIIAVLLGRQP